MRAELSQKGLYKHWVPEALEAFIEYGTKPVSNGIELSCDPAWEASIFGSYPRGLWEAVRKVSVPVEIMVASDSYSFIARSARRARSEEHTSELQSRPHLVCRLLLEKKKMKAN